MTSRPRTAVLLLSSRPSRGPCLRWVNMPLPTNPDYVRLWNDIKSNIPAAIDSVIVSELWRTMEDFLDQTNVWVEEIPFNVEPNVMQYTITPSKGVVDRLLMVFDPANASPDKRWTQQGLRFRPPDQILLAYSPSSMTTWSAAVSKNITDADLPPDTPVAEQLPVFDPDHTWIIDRYRDAFRYGTLAYL